MMACVSPSSLHLDESLQTLQYAHRARGIQNSPSVQIVRGGSAGGGGDGPSSAEVAQLREQLAKLSTENEALRRAVGNHPTAVGGAPAPANDAENAWLKKRVVEIESVMRITRGALATLQRRNEDMRQRVENSENREGSLQSRLDDALKGRGQGWVNVAPTLDG